jgi:hypothetical protein
MRRFLLVSLLVVALAVPTYGATSKQYTTPETPLKFADSAQTPNAQITLSALATLTGRISARFDRGAGAHSGYYTWRCTMSLTGTNIVDAVIELYIATSDGTNPDGQVGTADAALPAAKRKNLRPIGVLVVDQVTTNTNMTGSGVFFVPEQYFSLGVFNATTLPLQTSTTAHTCLITPVPFEMQ